VCAAPAKRLERGLIAMAAGTAPRDKWVRSHRV
jgi:hypothetical protein